MAKKLKQLAEKSAPDANLLKSVRDSAQEIWQAGLGAFAKAQQEGTKMFETLVKEGEGLSRKTRNIAESKISEVSGNVTKAASTISTKAQAQATEAWDKLEQVFEDRVARALNRLGVPTQKDVQALSKRVEDLTASLNAVTGAKPVARKATVRKPAARKAAPRKTATRRAA